MSTTKDYALASGGIFRIIFSSARFGAKTFREQLYWVFGMVMLCWLPPAIFSFFKLGWVQFYLLFLRDVATHVRFILAIPILIFARRFFNNRFNSAIEFFYETKIIDDANRTDFERVIRRLEKWKNSKIVDVIIVILIYLAFFVQEKSKISDAGAHATWYIIDEHITAAGWWYLLFSLPVLQLLLYRWLFTIILWIAFLRRISKLDLHLSALHPDGAGGLGFLQYTQLGLFPVALAFSLITAGVTNNLIIFSGISLRDYKVAIASVLLFVLFLFILPLLLLVPLLTRVKRQYFMQYSLQAWPITRKFEEQLKAFYQTEKENPDTSWHVDLQGSFEKAHEMKVVLINRTILIAFAGAVILPFLPVIAQQVPLREILVNLLGKILG